jgi:hypothetical protein
VTGEAKVLISLPSAQGRHAMEGLAALSKYVGCYNVWKIIREKYQLRWSNSEQENLKFFTNYMAGKGNFDEMFKWLQDAMSRLPREAANVLVFNTLTGLRPTETVLSIQLIKSEPEKYINKETGMLEHFRSPSVFLRQTKKAYISVMTPERCWILSRLVTTRQRRAITMYALPVGQLVSNARCAFVGRCSPLT